MLGGYVYAAFSGKNVENNYKMDEWRTKPNKMWDIYYEEQFNRSTIHCKSRCRREAVRAVGHCLEKSKEEITHVLRLNDDFFEVGFSHLHPIYLVFRKETCRQFDSLADVHYDEHMVTKDGDSHYWINICKMHFFSSRHNVKAN